MAAIVALGLGLTVFAAAELVLRAYRSTGGGGAANSSLTIDGLRGVLALVDRLEEDPSERSSPAPLTEAKLSQWIAGPDEWQAKLYFDNLGTTLDTEGQRLRDAWGNYIRVIAVEGKLYALASAGENGLWEHGLGDDIIISREVVLKGGRRQTHEPLTN